MRNVIFAAALVVSTFVWAPAQAQGVDPGNAQCKIYYSEFLGHDVNYCVDFAGERVPKERVVFFMHGLMGSAKNWISQGYAEALKVTCEKKGCEPTAFISFDTAPASFFSDTGGLKAGTVAYETWFLTEFIPLMQERYGLCSEKHCRALMGLSMGGFGALKTALRFPEAFSMVAVNSPALGPFSIFEPDGTWSDYWNRHPIGSFRGMLILDIVREIFPTKNLANQNDPSWLVKNWKTGVSFPNIYFDVGDRDDFGFQEGFERFSNALNGKGLPYSSALIPGGDHKVHWERRWVTLKFLLDNLR